MTVLGAFDIVKEETQTTTYVTTCIRQYRCGFRVALYYTCGKYSVKLSHTDKFRSEFKASLEKSWPVFETEEEARKCFDDVQWIAEIALGM